MLRDPAPEPPPPPPPPATRGRHDKTPPPPPPPPPPPDLTRLTGDEEARVRRRAALAIGRVGLKDGVQPLVVLLSDADAEVRQMAAFSLGLIGDKRAVEPLTAALNDPSPLVQGSAAEALGLIGDRSAAGAVASMMSTIVQSGALAQPPGDDMDSRRDTPAAAFRLGVYALVRLKAADQLMSTVLDSGGLPRVHWWPVAYGLGRLEDRRGFDALLVFAKDSNPYARAFAVKGLGALKNRAATPALLNLLSSGDRSVLIETIRALGRIGDPAAAAPILKFITESNVDPQVRLEAVGAIGGIRTAAATDTLLDILADPTPAVRAAALRSLATLDAENFVTVLSGLDDDPQWTVRASLANLLGTLPPEAGLARLNAMLNDPDQRVLPSVLGAMVKLRDPHIAEILLTKLKSDDPVVRAAAASGLAELKPEGAVDALTAAFRAAERDANNTARVAILGAIGRFGAAQASPLLRSAFADKDWSVRVRATTLLTQLDPSADVDPAIRPAPTTLPAETYSAERLVNPPVSTQVYIDTDRGSIQIELAVLDAPLTSENFVALARKGYFNGLSVHRVVPNFVVQDGDPRGDGEGAPGYSIRDELNELPYLRGTVGMALDPWPDSGGSQFFITHSPQPHLDARYTVFGRVVSGMDVVDQIQQGDVIRRIRVWDGQTIGEKN
jgi:HEAT repeat protein